MKEKKRLTTPFETKITFKDYINGFITTKFGAPLRINYDWNPENNI